MANRDANQSDKLAEVMTYVAYSAPIVGTLSQTPAGLAVGTVVGLGGLASVSIARRSDALLTAGGKLIPWISQEARVRKAVRAHARQKFREDLHYSCVPTPMVAETERNASRYRPVISRSLRSNDARLPKTNPIPKLAGSIWSGVADKAAIRVLRDFGKIRVFLPSTSVAALAVFFNAKKFFVDHGLDIEIQYNAPWGLDLVRKMEGNAPAHFVFTVDAPFFAATTKEVRSFRHAIALHKDGNAILRKAKFGGRRLKRVHLVSESTAWEATKVRKDLAFALDKKETEFPGIHRLADQLDADEGIYAWRPMLLPHLARKDLVIDTSTIYESYRSIAFHKSITRQPKVIAAFLSLYIALWNREVRCPSPDALLDDDEFLSYFQVSLASFG